MNQKLRTARSGIVILFAVLCIVCLSLSLAISAHFAAYAEGDEYANLDMNDGTNDLWLVHYEGQQTAGEGLLNGINNGKPIYYVDGSNEVREGQADEENCFTPYRGSMLTLKLNPDYVYNGTALGDQFDLDADNIYIGNSAEGNAAGSTNMLTLAEIHAKEGTETLKLRKEWTIVAFCNYINAPQAYIVNRGYAEDADFDLLHSVMGNTVVYHIKSTTSSYEELFAIDYEMGTGYLQAGFDANGYFVSPDKTGYDANKVSAANNARVNLFEYVIHRLPAGNYTLTVSAMPFAENGDGIKYAQSSKVYAFDVKPQELGDDKENDLSFDTFTYDIVNKSVGYTKGSEWVDEIGFSLKLGNVVLEENVDYRISVGETKVGYADLLIVGEGNLNGYHTIKNAVRITPAVNEWEVSLNIIAWTYGTYKAENNLIVGSPKLLDDPNDVTFRIEKLVRDSNGNVTGTEPIEALSDIHYYVYEESGVLKTNWIVTEDVKVALKDLDAGSYRLFASVYGAYRTDPNPDRNYQPIDETYIDFTVFLGTNSWKAGAEPTIKDGGWIEGKLSSTEGLINAESIFGNPVLMIYKLGENGNKDTLIYSNLPEHSAMFGDIEVLKNLKAGRYYLSARVEGTNNYGELVSSSILFTVTPNNLPVWAVILIVAGSLGIVALVFGILHQKGILQMLTGKVIVSMRTRANVDATLAAIRAAKVAREAEASIAAAKAREAEEQAKADKSEDK